MVVYRVDAGNQLTWVNDAWENFALENGGEAVLTKRIIGRNLLVAISGLEVRSIYMAILVRVRNGNTVQFDYRCDSPEKRRKFAMTVRPLARGGVEFESALLHEEVRPAVAFLDSQATRLPSMVQICSWCQNIAVAEGQWLPVEEAVAELHLMEAEKFPGIYHGICDECLTAIIAKHPPKDGF